MVVWHVSTRHAKFLIFSQKVVLQLFLSERLVVGQASSKIIPRVLDYDDKKTFGILNLFKLTIIEQLSNLASQFFPNPCTYIRDSLTDGAPLINIFFVNPYAFSRVQTHVSQ